MSKIFDSRDTEYKSPFGAARVRRHCPFRGSTGG